MPLDPDAHDRLRALADRFWDEFLADTPVFATIIGERRHDDLLDDRSPEAIDSRLARYERILGEAGSIDPLGLDERDRVTRQMLLDTAQAYAEVTRTRVDDWAVDPMSGPQTAFLDLSDYQTVSTPEDGERLVTRWRAMGPYLDGVVDGLRRASADGLVPVRTPVERTIEVLRGLDATPPTEWKLSTPAAEPHDEWSAADLDRFRADLGAAVTGVIAPAFARFRAALEDEVLPAARPADRPGLMHVPGGAEAYRAFIRYHTSLDLDPEAIHATGLAEIERIDAGFVELGGRLLGSRDLASTLAALRGDPKLRFETAEEVFETARASLERAQAATPAWFGRLPKAPCEVVPIPPHAEAHQTIAYYAWPAVDGSRPGRYYINLHEPTTRPRYEAEVLAFHESVPGHHLQLAIGQELEDLPAFQRLLGSTAFIEGWGLYTERLSDEMGLYSGELDRFGILSFDAWRAGRLVVDTGMHALGWTRQQAIDYLHDHTALGDNNIANEVDRYIVTPGQALAYKLGQLELLRLRAEARDRLGARFEIKDFHDTVLGSGAVSLPALRGIVDRWIAGA